MFPQAQYEPIAIAHRPRPGTGLARGLLQRLSCLITDKSATPREQCHYGARQMNTINANNFKRSAEHKTRPKQYITFISRLNTAGFRLLLIDVRI